jgi:hypothetical protein
MRLGRLAGGVLVLVLFGATAVAGEKASPSIQSTATADLPQVKALPDRNQWSAFCKSVRAQGPVSKDEAASVAAKLAAPTAPPAHMMAAHVIVTGWALRDRVTRFWPIDDKTASRWLQPSFPSFRTPKGPADMANWSYDTFVERGKRLWAREKAWSWSYAATPGHPFPSESGKEIYYDNGKAEAPYRSFDLVDPEKAAGPLVNAKQLVDLAGGTGPLPIEAALPILCGGLPAISAPGLPAGYAFAIGGKRYYLVEWTVAMPRQRSAWNYPGPETTILSAIVDQDAGGRPVRLNIDNSRMGVGRQRLNIVYDDVSSYQGLYLPAKTNITRITFWDSILKRAEATIPYTVDVKVTDVKVQEAGLSAAAIESSGTSR